MPDFVGKVGATAKLPYISPEKYNPPAEINTSRLSNQPCRLVKTFN
jgi:hypothetical protein